MATRNLFHSKHLEGLKGWLIERNWVIQEPKGDYEVFRAKSPKGKFVLLYRGHSSEHYSIPEPSYRIVKNYINSLRNDRKNGSSLVKLDKEKLKHVKKTISSEEALKDVKPYLSDEEIKIAPGRNTRQGESSTGEEAVIVSVRRNEKAPELDYKYFKVELSNRETKTFHYNVHNPMPTDEEMIGLTWEALRDLSLKLFYDQVKGKI